MEGNDEKSAAALMFDERGEGARFSALLAGKLPGCRSVNENVREIWCRVTQVSMWRLPELARCRLILLPLKQALERKLKTHPTLPSLSIFATCVCKLHVLSVPSTLRLTPVDSCGKLALVVIDYFETQ